jgi:hypothetical protein
MGKGKSERAIDIGIDVVAIIATFVATYLGVSWAATDALRQQDDRDRAGYCTLLSMAQDDCSLITDQIEKSGDLTADNTRPWNPVRLSAAWVQRPETLAQMDRGRAKKMLNAILARGREHAI